jgi:hypothetical protein
MNERPLTVTAKKMFKAYKMCLKKERRFFEEEEIRWVNLLLVYVYISTVAPSSINPKARFLPLI